MSHNAVVPKSFNCFSADCNATAKWGIASSVQIRNPNGSPLTLYACDKHEELLTARLRSIGTKYQLFPVTSSKLGSTDDNKMSDRPRPTDESLTDKQINDRINRLPPARRIILKLMIIIVTIIVTPFVLIYYGIKWISGWRP